MGESLSKQHIDVKAFSEDDLKSFLKGLNLEKTHSHGKISVPFTRILSSLPCVLRPYLEELLPFIKGVGKVPSADKLAGKHSQHGFLHLHGTHTHTEKHSQHGFPHLHGTHTHTEKHSQHGFPHLHGTHTTSDNEGNHNLQYNYSDNDLPEGSSNSSRTAAYTFSEDEIEAFLLSFLPINSAAFYASHTLLNGKQLSSDSTASTPLKALNCSSSESRTLTKGKAVGLPCVSSTPELYLYDGRRVRDSNRGVGGGEGSEGGGGDSEGGWGGSEEGDGSYSSSTRFHSADTHDGAHSNNIRKATLSHTLGHASNTQKATHTTTDTHEGSQVDIHNKNTLDFRFWGLSYHSHKEVHHTKRWGHDHLRNHGLTHIHFRRAGSSTSHQGNGGKENSSIHTLKEFHSLQEIVNAFSFLLFGKPRDHLALYYVSFLHGVKTGFFESFKVDCLKENHMLYNEVDLTILHMFSFAYLETIFLQESNYIDDLEENGYLVSDSSNDEETPTHTQEKQANANTSEQYTRRSLIWNTLNSSSDMMEAMNLVFAMEFRPLFASFRMYVKDPSDLSLVFAWFLSNFPLLPQNCSSALYLHFVKRPQRSDKFSTNEAPPTMCYQVYKRGNGDYKEGKETDENLSKAAAPSNLSPSLQSIIVKSKGLKGLWLNDSTRCLTDDICFALRQRSIELQSNSWCRLYASWKDGTAFSLLIKALLYYEAPTILVAKTVEGHVFGTAAFSPWKDAGHQFFGTNSTFLFAGLPTYRVFNSTGEKNKFMYLNSRNQFYPKGIGFGGETELFRLWIDTGLQSGYFTLSDSTFQSGSLCIDLPEADESSFLQTCRRRKDSFDDFKCSFKLSELEVWGAGGAEALKAQRRNRRLADEARMDGRIVDKSRLVNSQFDKDFLFGNTFQKGKGPVGFES